MPTQPARMADRMSAAHGAELTNPTRSCRQRFPKAATDFTPKADIRMIGKSRPTPDIAFAR
jgi:hypothetical protein